MNDVKKKLGEELERQIKLLAKLDPMDDEFNNGASGIATLVKEYAALEKVEAEKAEAEAAQQQLKQENFRRLIFDAANSVFHGVIEVAGIIVPIVFYHAWMQEGLKFEESGSFCSSTFRTLLGKIKPMK